MNSVEWNPKYNLLAYAGDDKNAKYNTDEGTAAYCFFVTQLLKFVAELTRSSLNLFAGVFRIFGFESS